MDDDIRTRLAQLELDPRLPDVEPEQEADEEVLAKWKARLEEIAPVTVEPVAPIPEPKPEPPKESGTLVLKFSRSVVKRDEEGRIVEILGEGSRKTVKRDEHGRIVEVIEETEQELEAT